MDDDALLRYSRQIMLPDMDIAGQEALLSAHILIVGAGGLGCPAALYLAAAGIGKLTLCDDDVVELSNLQRQIAHSQKSIGEPKTESARDRINDINPDTEVATVNKRVDQASLKHLLADVTLVLDCTDNFDARYLINDTCWQAGIPVVSGAAIRFEGQLAVFDPRIDTSPCYRCLYPTGDDAALNCSENGVIAPLVGIIGTYQALEAIKLIARIGPTLAGYVLYFDGKYSEWRKLKLNKRSDCPVCAVS
jgi:adenylyltransferase/sulfurtransferase